MKQTAYIVLTLAAFAGAAFALAPQRDIATSIRIAAPPERVWSILTDTAAFPAWNPEMTLKGALIQGHIIEHDEGSGDDRMVFHPVIVAMVPNHDLAWLGHSGPPRFFDACTASTSPPMAVARSSPRPSTCVACSCGYGMLGNYCLVSRQ